MKAILNVTAAAIVSMSAVGLAAPADFGEQVEALLNAQSLTLFGIVEPLPASAVGSVPRAPNQVATDLVDLAGGLQARIVTRDAGDSTDMMVPWPVGTAPRFLITCVEGARTFITPTKLNPSVQRIRLSDGHVETILRGMTRCDGIRPTPWGSILATEEVDDGGAYEILAPLATTEEIVQDRGAAGMPATITEADGVTPSTRIAKRTALPTMAWEGLALTTEGVVIAGDELRPGTSAPDTDGGAIFKFIPTTPWDGVTPVDQLGDSPFVAGVNYAMQVSCNTGSRQYGQGCEIGKGTWVSVSAATARTDADVAGATGYYRPEDLHSDPTYAGAGIRVCWTNTGNATGDNFGEVLCAVDTAPLIADLNQQTFSANRFIEGDADLNQPDNLDFQPGSGNVYVIEDNTNGDIFACLPDGADRDIKSDGCIKVLSVKDQSAEPTGFIFGPSGRVAFLSIQHSTDTAMPNFDDYRTDDVIVIWGFR